MLQLVAALAMAVPAAADMQVIESNVAKFGIGMRLADNSKIELKPGERVKVLMLPSNQTKVFTGGLAPLSLQPVGGVRGSLKKMTE
jgi:hypothetical protein